MPVKTATSNSIVKDRRYFDLFIDSACYIEFVGPPFGTGDSLHLEEGFGNFMGNPHERYFSIRPTQGQLTSDIFIDAFAMGTRRSMEMPLGFLNAYTLGLTDLEQIPAQGAGQGSPSNVNVEIEENPIGHVEAPIVNIYRLKIVDQSGAIVYPSPVRELDESLSVKRRMASDWIWYDIVDSPTDLQQGDILENLTFPELSRGSGEMVERAYTAIVMTQSCDIEDDIRHIVFCPIWTREKLAETIPAFKNENDILPKLTKGHVVGFYPLSKCTLPGLEMSWRIVQFHRILEVERNDVLDQLHGMGQRRRLRSPYRESLSQHFARYFMRVGLPIPVDASQVS